MSIVTRRVTPVVLIPSPCHQWPVDSELEKRQIEKARELGPNSIKSLVTPPVTTPIDYEDLPV